MKDYLLCRSPSGRAQSEVIGVAMLTGVIVIVALIVGAVVITQASGDDTGPTTDFVLDVSSSDVTVSHNGGDSLELSELTVIFESDGTQRRFTPDAGNVTGTDPGFDPGERLQRLHGFPSGDLTVRIVHTPSNTVLFEDRKQIPI